MPAEPTSALGLPGTRVLLVGTGGHAAGSPLPRVPAVADTLADLGRTLVEHCGLDPGHLRTVLDPADLVEFASALAETAQQATDVLVVYYVGHGLVSPGGELHLATLATDDLSEALSYKALPYSTVRQVLSGSSARSKVVVLDCCFSGRARAPFGNVNAVTDAFQLAYVRGSYLLTSASGEAVALAPPGERYTAFSGELIRLLREGDPAAPRALTLEEIYRCLDRALPARGRPTPQRQADGRAGDLVLGANTAYRPPQSRTRAQSAQLSDPAAPPDRPGPAVPAGAAEPAGVAESWCPYRGLRRFDAQDAPYFFGREQLIADSVRRLAERIPAGGPLAVVGSSGSGKSSLLRAGLLPAVDRGDLDISGDLDIIGSRDWPQRVMTPGGAPIAALATLLTTLGDSGSEAGGPAPGPAELADEIRADPLRLAAIIRRVLARRAATGRAARTFTQAGTPGTAGTPLIPAGRLILVVDQFEELFTVCQDEDERRGFVQALLAASEPDRTGAPAPFLVVLGVRADFYGRCLDYPQLRPALETGQVVVGAMTPDESHEAIARPAQVAGLALEPGLTELMLHDLRAGQPAEHDSGGALPLLSYALQATWQQREGRLLTLAGYRAAGGIWDAVARSADRIYDGLDADAQQAARHLLLRMVRIGDRTDDTRRRINLAEFLQGRPAEEAAATARARDALADPGARLITLTDESIEITHEALLRAWPRLREWIDEDRAGLLIGQHLADSAETWQQQGRDDAYLYTGSRLASARSWAEAGGRRGLGALEQSFLDVSTRVESAQQLRERRQHRRLRVLTGALGVFLVLALIAAGVAAYQRGQAVYQRGLAVQQQHTALSTSLSFESANTIATNLRKSDMLALASWQTAQNADSRGSLLSSTVNPYLGSFDGGGTADISAVAVSPDSRLVATGDTSETVRIWEMATRRLLATFPGLGAPVYRLMFSPDGKTLSAAVSSPNRGLVQWDVATLRELPVADGNLAGVSTLAYSPDGRVLAISAVNHRSFESVELWDQVRHTETAALSGFPGFIWGLAFSPDGSLIATSGSDGTVRLWDASTGAPRAVLTGDTAAVWSVQFSPDGKSLVTASSDGDVRVWNVASGTSYVALTDMQGDQPYTVFSPDGRWLVGVDGQGNVDEFNLPSREEVDGVYNLQTELTNLAFSPDGHTLVVGGTGGSLVALAWDRVGLTSSSSFTTVAFNPDGRSVATGVADGTVVQWPLDDPASQRVLPGQVGQVTTVAYSPDGQLLVIGGLSGSAGVWDVTTGQQVAALIPPGTSSLIVHASFSPDGSSIFTVNNLGVLDLWNARDFGRGPMVPTTSRTLVNPPDSVVYSPDGRTLAVGEGGVVQLLDSSTLKPTGTIDVGPTTLEINALAFSPDGRVLALAGTDQTVQFWNVTSHELVGKITGLTARATHLVFSPDGQTLATTSEAGTVNLWNVADHTLLATLTGNIGQVNAVAFSPDGQTLVSVDSGGAAIEWNLNPAARVTQLCQALRSPTFSSEWYSLDSNIGPPPCDG